MGREFSFKLRFQGGATDTVGLDLYDGSASFHGFARALQITTHAFLNDDVVTRATALKGASLAFGPPTKGSIIFDIAARFDREPKAAPLEAETFYDFTRVAFARATGDLEAAAETSYVESRLATDESSFDALAETLEGSLQQAHRSVDNEAITVSLESPNSSLVLFDKNTSAWVNTRDEDPTARDYTGNMTRFNTQTGNGRAYVRDIRKIVPVRKSDRFKDPSKKWLTWSLHGSNISTAKDLILVGRKIESATGETKRILLDDCRKA